MKKFVPALLFIIICINHLNIIDVVVDFGARYGKENCKIVKAFAGDEEPDTEKENKGKEKVEEQEKYYSKNNYSITNQYKLSDKDKFICYNTKLNPHPYQDDDIQPPKAA